MVYMNNHIETDLDRHNRAARILRAIGGHSDFCIMHTGHSGDCIFTDDDDA